MTTIPETTSPRAIQIGDAPPQVGPHRTWPTSLCGSANHCLWTLSGIFSKSSDRARVTAAANHVLRSAKSQQSSGGLLVCRCARHPPHGSPGCRTRADDSGPAFTWYCRRITADWATSATPGTTGGITKYRILIRKQIGEAVLARAYPPEQLIGSNPRPVASAKLGPDPSGKREMMLEDTHVRGRAQYRSFHLQDHVHVGQ